MALSRVVFDRAEEVAIANRTWIEIAALGVTLALPGTALASDAAAIAVGKELVTTYCADCHAVGPTGESPFPPAPHFRDLHLRYDVEFLGEALVEGILTAHPAMPEFEFDPDQAAAIVAYLKSLEPPVK